jgi:hypothetical protein
LSRERIAISARRCKTISIATAQTNVYYTLIVTEE